MRMTDKLKRLIYWTAAIAVGTAVIMNIKPVEAHPDHEKPWAADIVYIKDERTKACFAVKESVYHYGPYFTYVPCELVDKADWKFYNKAERGER